MSLFLLVFLGFGLARAAPQTKGKKEPKQFKEKKPKSLEKDLLVKSLQARGRKNQK